ncbi:LytR C-terminal domain-containing protein [uncultured Nocardioides sp.]|uniref:LytR C-terminal domain-containing protein n=1 Tax=uncultured Nocardioides sp. TaxID=198441 RepID=UPI002621EB4B|nr:LytR C-terminal domain-containing protein [uncultured Nocardioides sp.]
MSRKIRSAITLTVMAVVILAGATWAWAALTDPFPEGGLFGGGGTTPEVEVCAPRAFGPGDTLSTGQVTVSVLNAGSTAGAAAGTLEELVGAGFGEGVEGNAPEDADVDFVQIWTGDPANPSVRLVKTWVGEDTLVVERELDSPEVFVVVGDRFGDLAEGRESVQVQRDVEVCGPANAG